MSNEETLAETWHVEGDRLDGRHQFTVRDADDNIVLGVDATDPVLSGYGKEADDRSRRAEGQPLAWRRAQLAARAPVLLRERDEAREQSRKLWEDILRERSEAKRDLDEARQQRDALADEVVRALAMLDYSSPGWIAEAQGTLRAALSKAGRQ